MPTIERRIRDAAWRDRKISFLVETPTSESGIPVQSVMMKDFVVKKTADGHRIVQGRDLAKERQQDFLQGRIIQKGAHRKKAETVVRSYRIDRIVPRTLIEG
jgi:hypothetical protein